MWQALFNNNNIEFETHDLSEAIGKDIVEKHNIKSFPALIINDKVVAVGHPNEEVARKITNQVLIITVRFY